MYARLLNHVVFFEHVFKCNIHTSKTNQQQMDWTESLTYIFLIFDNLLHSNTSVQHNTA